MKRTELNDETLVELFRSGDNEAFDFITRRYWSIIFNVLMTKMKNPDLAHNATQDVMLKLLVKLKNPLLFDNAPCKLKAWILTIVNHYYIDYFRKEARSVVTNYGDMIDIANYADDYFADNAEDIMIRNQRHDQLRDNIQRLVPEQKEVLIMREYGGMNYREIADVTEVSINTALGRMWYALKNLRKMIKADDSALLLKTAI